MSVCSTWYTLVCPFLFHQGFGFLLFFLTLYLLFYFVFLYIYNSLLTQDLFCCLTIQEFVVYYAILHCNIGYLVDQHSKKKKIKNHIVCSFLYCLSLLKSFWFLLSPSTMAGIFKFFVQKLWVLTPDGKMNFQNIFSLWAIESLSHSKLNPVHNFGHHWKMTLKLLSYLYIFTLRKDI